PKQGHGPRTNDGEGKGQGCKTVYAHLRLGGYLDEAQWQMAVHCRRGHGVAQKEVKETRLGVTDPSGHARRPNLSFVRLAEGNEYGGRSGVSPHFLHKHTSDAR